jgi:hypothetical protein
MKINIKYTLNSGASFIVTPRRMHGKDTHISIIMSIDEKRIEVIASKDSIMRNGVLGYFAYSVRKIMERHEKINKKRELMAHERNCEFKAPSIMGRDANCIILYENFKTGIDTGPKEQAYS